MHIKETQRKINNATHIQDKKKHAHKKKKNKGKEKDTHKRDIYI